MVETKVHVEEQVNLTEGELIEGIRELRDRQQYDLAADAAFKALIQYPESVPAKLLSAEIEIERGNKTLAEEIIAPMMLAMGRTVSPLMCSFIYWYGWKESRRLLMC